MTTSTVPDYVSEEARLAASGIREFVDREIVPIEERLGDTLTNRRKRFDPAGRFVPEVLEAKRQARMRSASAGFYTMFTPPELGGAGLGAVTRYFVWDALYHHAGPSRLLAWETLPTFANGVTPILLGLQPAVREQFLAGLQSGDRSLCFALSEPDAGSDVWAMRTRAVRDGDDWVINGSKQWITNGPYADYAMIFAITNPELVKERRGGISCFFVDTSTPGCTVDSVIRLFGDIGGDEAIFSFNDVRVGSDRIIGTLDDGFGIALDGISIGRLVNGARCSGLALWALERATSYAKQRVTFGHPLADNQAIQWMLADSAIDIYTSRCIGLDCARRIEKGEDAVRETAMVKAYNTEACFRVYDRAIQVFGGLGLTNEVELHEGFHFARIVRIADGPAEIMRRTIAGRILKGHTGF